MSHPKSAPSLRLALIGAGVFASSAHRTQLLKLVQNSTIHVQLVWSRSKAAAENLAIQYGPHVLVAYHDPSKHVTPLHSVQSALHQHLSNLDAVILALPIPQLASFAHLVLECRLHLLQEKPLAADLTSASRLLSLSKPDNVVHAVAENYRFERVFRRARSFIPQICNNVIALHLSACTPMPRGSRYAKDWRLNLPDAGILLDGIVHHIAGMRVLLGADVKTVMALCSRRGDMFVGCDTVSGTLTFSNDIPANIFVTYVSSTFLWELRVIGTDGDILISRKSGQPGYILSLLDPTKSEASNKKMEMEMEIPFNGLDTEFEAFLASCAAAKVHPDLDARTAFNDLATVQAMFESSQKGRLVPVTPLSQLGMEHAPAKTF